jgi:hypothetical protein
MILSDRCLSSYVFIFLAVIYIPTYIKRRYIHTCLLSVICDKTNISHSFTHDIPDIPGQERSEES